MVVAIGVNGGRRETAQQYSMLGIEVSRCSRKGLSKITRVVSKG